MTDLPELILNKNIYLVMDVKILNGKFRVKFLGFVCRMDNGFAFYNDCNNIYSNNNIL